MNNPKWLSVHLHFNSNSQVLLLKGIGPVIEQFESRNLINSFFFVRYFKDGSHIRLRVLPAKQEYYLELSLLLKKYFFEFYTKTPGLIYPDLEIDVNEWIRFVDYEPELERYGGNESIKEVEKQFNLSSRTVIGYLKALDHQDFSLVLGTAVELNVSFAYAIGLSKDSIRVLFRKIYDQWFEHAARNTYRDYFLNDKSRVIDMCEKRFEKDRIEFSEFIPQFWHALQLQGTIVDPVLSDWILNNTRIFSSLYVCIRTHEVATHLEQAYKQEKSLSIAADLMHMTNNRLGVSNLDEGYIAYLIAKCI
jgi:thiopeptide-type bacteriocin biosynthesis protein